MNSVRSIAFQRFTISIDGEFNTVLIGTFIIHFTGKESANATAAAL